GIVTGERTCDMKDMSISNVNVRLTEGLLNIDFHVRAKVRPCDRKNRPRFFWIVTHSDVHSRFRLKIVDWILAAELDSVHADASNRFIDIIYGIFQRRIDRAFSKPINKFLARATGTNLKTEIQKEMPDPSMLSEHVALNVTVRENGLYIELPEKPIE
ncbi:MAG: hypothetical protein HQK54_05555, partial [Oligoflexales bacterium]|nr:hypothetical protein [Oligoflexales bacterium]